MFKLIKAPKSNYSDKYENAKFLVTWNIFIFLFFIFLSLGMYHFSTGDPNVLTSVLALIFTTFSLFYLQNSRKYELSAIITVIAGTFISQYGIFIIDDSERIIDLMWMMLIAFYAFYTLGSKWGVFIFILNLSGLLLKVTLFTGSIRELGLAHHINTVINIAIASAVVVFIIHKMVKSSELLNQELKTLNSKLKTQNNEKTVLLKEIHHRVKNNLQVVSSLLRLQANDLTDENTISQFNEAISRISSMALIHEKMYQKEDLANLDLKVYLDSLIQELMNSYSTTKNISAIVHSELDQMEVKNLVPVALIFNELITNSLKHAFNDLEGGEISINITTKEQDVLISYKDTGRWIKPENEYSFGITLIDAFTEQLDGKYTVNYNNGTEYQFCFSTPRK